MCDEEAIHVANDRICFLAPEPLEIKLLCEVCSAIRQHPKGQIPLTDGCECGTLGSRSLALTSWASSCRRCGGTFQEVGRSAKSWASSESIHRAQMVQEAFCDPRFFAPPCSLPSWGFSSFLRSLASELREGGQAFGLSARFGGVPFQDQLRVYQSWIQARESSVRSVYM